MTITFVWITAGAFLLGALPFSLWIGYLVLHKDIRSYGDGNPGAANVFRAGNPAVGMMAVLLDIFKGVPVVYLAGRNTQLSENQLLIVAFAAIMGHAFSPLLRLRGGKAVAVTYGALIGLVHLELLVPFVIAAIVGLLVFENHSWVVLCAPIVTLVSVFLGDAGAGMLIFMTGILLLYVFKHARELAGWPRPRSWIHRWFQPRRQA
ncbi:MAG: glycerol-3-phosphate acyltransferase [Dehalococcoidia bacterium]|nr:glycerol-3-phosphate acyltransferase [Dehalococcoidia bacterium]